MKGLHIVTEERGALDEEPVFSETSGSFVGEGTLKVPGGGNRLVSLSSIG